MCLKKKKTIKENALHIIGIGIGTTIIILLIISWFYKKYTFDGANINAEITSSYGTVVGAFLSTLWNGIAVWIYYSALKIQSNELKTSQEVAFGQNLSFLISRSSDTLSKLQLKGILNHDYEGHKALDFLFMSLMYCYDIMKKDNITPIINLEEEKNRLKEYEVNNPDKEMNEIVEEKEMEMLAYNNPTKFFAKKRYNFFRKYMLDFQYLFMLSNDDLKWKNKNNREYSHIQDAFYKVWDKYGYLVQPYFMTIENSISYLSEYESNPTERKKYARWITSNISQPGLAFFYYYLYCQKEDKRNLIIHCQTLNIFKDLNMKHFLLDKSHAELKQFT